MNVVGREIYLDMDQCQLFGAEYFKKHWTALNSKDVLESKKSGYDEQHRIILTACNGKYIVLERYSGQKPGWYTITKKVDV